MPFFEYNLSVNDFLEPQVSMGPEAICTLLVRLLLLEPNTFDTHPDMGVGIVSRYRYSFKGRGDELRRDFQNQINKYIPALAGIIINVNELNNVYYITARIDKTVYGINFDENFNVSSDYKTLSDL